MTFFSPTQFFDLENFKWKSLFDNVENVWEVLDKLPLFFKELSLPSIDPKLFPGVYFENVESIVIEEGVTLEKGAFIKGPCFLGKGTQVRHGAYIRGFFIAGEECVIGHATEVKNAIFLNKVHAAHFAYIGDSILGSRVNLGAGVRCANLKLDQGLIFVKDGQSSVSTKRKKLGAVLGDFSSIGCNAVLNPGTFVGKYSIIYPCLNVGGNIPSNKKIKPKDSLYVEE